MNARWVSAAADLICRTMKVRQTAAGIAAALDAAGMLQSPESAAETERVRAEIGRLNSELHHWRYRYYEESRTYWDAELPPGGECCAECGQPVESEPCRGHNPRMVAERLRARVAELESAPPLAWGRHLDTDDLHALLSDMATALLGYWHDDSDPAVLARVDAELARHRALAAEEGQEFTPSPWQRAVDGLNALVHAGIGFHIEPDGHISNPAGGEHIEWDRNARRWRLVCDDEADEVPLTAEQIAARRQGYRASMRAAGGDLP